MDFSEVNVVLIGAGNVATQLGIALRSAGLNIRQVYSRTTEKAEALAEQLSCEAINDLQDIHQDAALYILAVSDGAIESVLNQLPNLNGVIAHTSGVTSHTVVAEHGFTGGYFYPLQTFVADEAMDMTTCPIFVKANEAAAEQLLLKVAQKISNNVKVISDEQKKHLHLSAVIVNNFVNHLYALTTDMLRNEHLDFTDLEPIIESTIQRALANEPKSIQTGPARRNDTTTIEEHLAMLKHQPLLRKVYKCLSKSIIKYYE
ncbi:MAG: DUF2520 domain-containing protein [Saprospiraceae bacterium]|nr:DUF2520 domain-containing protein [Saprospiraceae bacterium]